MKAFRLRLVVEHVEQRNDGNGYRREETTPLLEFVVHGVTPHEVLTMGENHISIFRDDYRHPHQEEEPQ